MGCGILSASEINDVAVYSKISSDMQTDTE